MKTETEVTSRNYAPSCAPDAAAPIQRPKLRALWPAGWQIVSGRAPIILRGATVWRAFSLTVRNQPI